MNILFFLTPKEAVSYILETDTLAQVLGKMENHGYTAIPLLSRTGKYIGTVTEGDLLWALKEKGFPQSKQLERIKITSVKRRRDNQPVDAQTNMKNIYRKVTNQNFVPVVDDNKVFIGIITRKDMLLYLMKSGKDGSNE